MADTIGGFVRSDDLDRPDALVVILCGVGGTVAWNLLTWRAGIPSSSSHALVGALSGAVVAASGLDHVVWASTRSNTDHSWASPDRRCAAPLPLLGFALAFLLQRGMHRALARATPRANRRLRSGQWLTAAGLAFPARHQRCPEGMGILTSRWSWLLPGFEVPLWVCSSAPARLGTLFGGWRIVRTLASICIRPLHH
ncbi:MAG: inorganic phosphate transporter [Myxococcota bacterium]